MKECVQYQPCNSAPFLTQVGCPVLIALAGTAGGPRPALALSVFVGIALPAACGWVFKHVFVEALLVLLALAFLRVDPAELRRHLTRPGLIAAATIWTMLIVPAVLGTLFLAFRPRSRACLGSISCWCCKCRAPGLMSVAGARSADGARRRTHARNADRRDRGNAADRQPFHSCLSRHRRSLSPLEFGLKLFLIIAGCAVAAAIIRRIAGRGLDRAHREERYRRSERDRHVHVRDCGHGRRLCDHFRADPRLVIELTALAFLLALASHRALPAIVFQRAGRARAFAIGLIAGNRNIGLMLAATGFAMPDMAWLYFALAQFPIYLLPHLLKPLARRLSVNR